MAPKKKKDAKLTRAGVSGYNKPKRTPNHPKKSHVVVAKVGDKTKLIRWLTIKVKILQMIEHVSISVLLHVEIDFMITT